MVTIDQENVLIHTIRDAEVEGILFNGSKYHWANNCPEALFQF